MAAVRRSKGTAAVPRSKTLKPGDPHAHGCPGCGDRFRDNCWTPYGDPKCFACRTGREPPVWQSNHRPRDCCYVYAQATNVVDNQRFQLGSTCDWFICRECKRQLPFRNPSRSTANDVPRS